MSDHKEQLPAYGGATGLSRNALTERFGSGLEIFPADEHRIDDSCVNGLVDGVRWFVPWRDIGYRGITLREITKIHQEEILVIALVVRIHDDVPMPTTDRS